MKEYQIRMITRSTLRQHKNNPRHTDTHTSLTPRPPARPPVRTRSALSHTRLGEKRNGGGGYTSIFQLLCTRLRASESSQPDFTLGTCYFFFCLSLAQASMKIPPPSPLGTLTWCGFKNYCSFLVWIPLFLSFLRLKFCVSFLLSFLMNIDN
jgi:hypothetical protein